MALPYMNGSMNNSLEQRIGGNFIARRRSHEKSDQISEHMAVALKRLSIKSSIAVSALRHGPGKVVYWRKKIYLKVDMSLQRGPSGLGLVPYY